jgi:hypothetical protein
MEDNSLVEAENSRELQKTIVGVLSRLVPPPPAVPLVIAPQALQSVPPMVRRMSDAAMMWQQPGSSFEDWLQAIGVRSIEPIVNNLNSYLAIDGGITVDDFSFMDGLPALQEALPNQQNHVLRRIAMGLSALQQSLGIDMSSA